MRPRDYLKLTPDEALLLCDAFNGTWLDDDDIDPRELIARELQDCDDLVALGVKWEVNVPVLQARILTLPREQAELILIAVAAFWGSELPFDEAISEVGLV